MAHGMGTTVQCKSYGPGCYPMMDLNEDPISSWSLCNKDKTFCGQLYNDFNAGPSYGYSEYDKEMLKQKMLEQEAIFQKQVYELHRLYQTQKDLMDKLKKKKIYGFSGAMDVLNSNMLAYQMPPEAGEKVCHVPHPFVAKACYSTVNAAGLEEKGGFFYLLKEVGLQCGPKSTENIGPLNDLKELDSKLNTLPKRMFDLHLPADAYITCEDTERTEKEIVTQSCIRDPDPHGVICSVDPDNSAKLDVGTVELSSCKETRIPNLHLRNDLPIHGLDDVNETIKDLDAEGYADLGAIIFNDVKSHSKKVELHLTTMSSKTSFPPGDFMKDLHREEGARSRCFNADKEEIRRNGPMLHNDSGHSRSIKNSLNSGPCIEMCAMSWESIQLKHKESHESYLHNQNKNDTLFGESQQPVEISEMSSDLVNLNNPALTATQVTRPLSVDSCWDHVPTTTPASSWRKPVKKINHIPIAVQALPCFTGFAMMNGQRRNRNSVNDCDKLQSRAPRLDIKSSRNANVLLNDLQLESESTTHIHLSPITLNKPNLYMFPDNSSYENSKSHETQSCFKGFKCTDVNTAKDLELKSAIQNVTQEGSVSQNDLSRKHDKSSGDSFWLKQPKSLRSHFTTKYNPQMDSQFTDDNTQMICSFRKGAEEIAREGEEDKVSSQSIFQSSMLLQAKEGSIKRDGIFNGPGKGMSSFSLLHEFLPNFNCSSSVLHHKQSSADDTMCNRKGNGVRINNRYDISLGSGWRYIDDPKLSVISAKDESEFTSSTYLPTFAANSTRKINFKTSVIELENDDPVSKGDIVKTDRHKNDLNKSREMKSSYDTYLEVAADTIVSMSMDVQRNLDNFSPLPSAPASCDMLFWFAGVVVSGSGIAGVDEGRGDGDFEDLDDDGLDVFEVMTLKLEEVKEDEYWCRPFQKEKLEDEEKSSASLLMRRRRGQGRKRRQRRDFQKDILPALASLSRHEVTEDLQTLGGMIRTSCKSRQSCPPKSGLNPLNKGRRPPRHLAVTIADVHANQPPIQPTHAQSVVDERTRGRTRRGQRQRTNACIHRE